MSWFAVDVCSFAETHEGMCCRKLDEWCSLLLLRAGGTLLTPWERVWYGLSIGVIVVLVSMGVSHAVAFYARVLSQSILGPN